MDTITTAIVGALANLSTNAIKDAYEGLKTAIVKKFGETSDLTKAVKDLQQKPESAGRRETLKEEVANAQVNADSEILSLAQNLLDKLNNLASSSQAATNINQEAGHYATQFGQVGRDVHIKQ